MKLVLSAMQRLKNLFGPWSEVWARTFLPCGAVASSTTFQTLPAPTPVLAAVQPGGSWPTLAPSSDIVNVGAAEAVAEAMIAEAKTIVSRIMVTLLKKQGGGR